MSGRLSMLPAAAVLATALSAFAARTSAEHTPGVRFAVVAALSQDTGANVAAPLVRGLDGSHYGIATYGGNADAGSVFRVGRDGIVSDVHRLAGDGSEGRNPVALLLGGDGALYGSTATGGVDDQGVLFAVSPDGEFAVLHHFARVGGDGRPTGAIARDGAGNLYGALIYVPDYGQVYRWSPDGQLATLHRFRNDAEDGAYPTGGVSLAADGLLVGTTAGGGESGSGTIFAMRLDGAVRTLHSFDFATEGGQANAVPLLGADGALYGLLPIGGPAAKGSMYRLGPDGVFSLLHAFRPNDPAGNEPSGVLSQDERHVLYGASSTGGEFGRGAVFALSPGGRGMTVLHVFAESRGGEGLEPMTAPAVVPGGLLGATWAGGSARGGVVYRLRLH